MSKRKLVCALAASAVLAVPAMTAFGQSGRRGLGVQSSREAPSASVNICGGGAGTLGVRVEAPYRGEELAPHVRVVAEYYSSQDGAWHTADGGDSGWYQAGGPGTGSSTGYTFPFHAPDPGYRLVMRGIVQLQWRGPGGESTELATGVCEVPGAEGTPVSGRAKGP